MASKTDNIGLDLYDTGDAANLRDQYNSSMHTLDETVTVINTNTTDALTKANTAIDNLEALGVTDTTSGETLKNTIENHTDSINTINGQISNIESVTIPGINESISEVKDTADNALSLAQTNESDIADIDANLNALHANSVSDATNLYNQIQNYSTTINTAQSTALTGKTHLVIIGDSFTSEVVRSYSWPSKIADNWDIHNYASGGTGWVQTGSQTTGESNKIFRDQLTEAIDDNTYNHDLVYAVIAYGSYNDYVNDKSATEVREAITTFYNAARSAYPGARIIIVIGNNGFGNRSQCDGYPYWLNQIYRGTSNAGFMSCCTNAYYWLYGFAQDTVFNEDGLHPNTQGAAIIARYMTAILEGNFNPDTIIYESVLAGDSSGGQSGNLISQFTPSGRFNMRGQYTFNITTAGDNYTTFDSIGDGRFTQYYGQTCIPLQIFPNGQYITGSYLNPSNGRFHAMATNEGSAGSVYYGSW